MTSSTLRSTKHLCDRAKSAWDTQPAEREFACLIACLPTETQNRLLAPNVRNNRDTLRGTRHGRYCAGWFSLGRWSLQIRWSCQTNRLAVSRRIVARALVFPSKMGTLETQALGWENLLAQCCSTAIVPCSVSPRKFRYKGGNTICRRLYLGIAVKQYSK